MAEQLDGRLRITPEAVFSASEVLSDFAHREMTHAWGSTPFDVYAATETAGISSPCALDNRHICDDLVILEPVDDHGAPAPGGTTGARLWVTVLFSRTLPLIRYELSDQVKLAGRGCPCGRPFGLIAGVEGRSEDVPSIPLHKGLVRVHPNEFNAVLDELTVAQWQVVHEAGALRILLVATSTQIR